jgi:biopolymer transport protein ExbB
MISFIDMLQKGGVLVWPILACSLVGTTVFFERLLTFRANRDRNGTAGTVLALLARGELAEARRVLAGRGGPKRRSSPENILRQALSVPGRDRKTMETVLAHAVSRELDILSRHLGILATAGNIAPLLGLLGTVFGMIKAFIQVEALGGRVNAAVLAGGIWEAMLTTAFGLVVAIPLIVFHGYLEARLGIIQTDLEDVAVAVLKNWPAGKE